MNNVPPPYEPPQPQWYAAPPPAYAPPPQGKPILSVTDVADSRKNVALFPQCRKTKW